MSDAAGNIGGFSMKRLRVHELAKELAIPSRELLQKMNEIGFSDKNHMSTLSEEEAAQVRAYVDGSSGAKLKLEEQRVSGGVIRRRRKIVVDEPKKPAVEKVDLEESAAKEPQVEEAAVSGAAEQLEAEHETSPAVSEQPKEEERGESAPDVEAEKTVESGHKAVAEKEEAKKEPASSGKEESKPEVMTDPSYTRIRVVKREEDEEEEKRPPAEEDAEALMKKFEALRKQADTGGASKIPKVEVVDMRSFAVSRGFRPRKRTAPKGGKGKKTEITTPKAIKRVLKMGDNIIISDLAKRIGVKAGEVIAKLMQMGVMATINQAIDFETAQIVLTEFNWEAERVGIDERDVIEVTEDRPEDLKPRAPVVTVMGHVDHGKTKLLDAIRSTNVTDAEAGGITQHIGASEIEINGKKIVFLDTPGHEAFTSLRARGAKVTDIVVLVVAADDGVMPQTVEAINHAKAAEVPIIVAVNKIDKPDANPDRVIQQLAEHGLVPEDWGGDTIFVKTSAKKGEGIQELLEMILLQAEMMELKANPDKLAKGTIIEARLDRGRGPVATVIVQEGTLHVGDTVISGVHMGKVRALITPKGESVKEAGPSSAVEVVGLHGVPQAGDSLHAVADEKKAKQLVEARIAKAREAELAANSKVTLEELYQKIESGETKVLKVVLKADVIGSLEALVDAFKKLSTDKVRVDVIHQAVGGITEGDVLLASASNAVVIGFNVRPEPGASATAEKEGVQIKLYTIIYEAVDELKKAMEGLLEPVYKEVELGRLEVRQTFNIPKVGTVAGCYVVSGKITRQSSVRLVRDGVVVYTGKLSSLKRFKNDAREVVEGLECGLAIEGYNDIKVGDIIEAFVLEEEKPTLD